MAETDFEDVVGEEIEEDEGTNEEEDVAEDEEAEEEEEEEDDDDEDDEDDLKDPLVAERQKCLDSFQCHGFKHAFEACQTRVNDEGVKENCTPEFFDLLECRDKCVGHGNIFHILK